MKGWGEPEEDVLQGLESAGQPSDNNAEVVLQLEGEISDLRQKIRSEQEEKAKLEAKLNEELNAAKVKHGKLTLKVKQLSKELKARKSSSPASATSGLGDDSLDKAIQVNKSKKLNIIVKDTYHDLQKLPMWVSMTSLLMHNVAHFTRPSFRPKTNNQPIQKFLSLAVG